MPPKGDYIAHTKTPDDVFRDKLALLFPHATAEILNGDAFPLANWRAGEKPKTILEIDREIIILKNNHWLRSVKELEFLVDKTWVDQPQIGPSHRRQWACPFYRARWWTAFAAARAQESVRHRRQHLQRLEKNRAEVASLIKKFQKFDARFKPVHVAPIYTYGSDRLDPMQISPMIEAAQIARDQIDQSLKKLAEMIRSEERRITSRRPEEEILWAQTFLEEMGHVWRFLTSINPSSSSDPFKNFVTAAAASAYIILDGNLENNIRAGVERVLGTRCLIPGFDGAFLSQDWKDALWDKFCTGAPQRRRRSVEQYKIVKRA